MRNPDFETSAAFVYWIKQEENTPAIWQLDIHSLEVKKVPLDIPHGFGIYGYIQPDPVTGRHYCKIRTLAEVDETGKKIEYFLYCLETQEKIRIPFPAYLFNVYGDFIGIRSTLKDNDYIAQYHYSYNKGRHWETETPKTPLLQAIAGMYGKGHVWSMSSSRVNGIYFPLLVRIPPKEEW